MRRRQEAFLWAFPLLNNRTKESLLLAGERKEIKIDMKTKLTEGSFFQTATRVFAVAVLILGVAICGWASEASLFQFTGTNGSGPQTGLIFDAAGSLYGTTFGGGPFGGGIVFKLAPMSGGHRKESILYSFKGGSDGALPSSDLVMDNSGNLYGVTYQGGGSTNCNGGCGTVFKLSPTSSGAWKESILHRFSSKGDGAYPVGSVIFDAQGNLYGTTQYGGPSSRGTAFQLTPTSTVPWKETILHSFTGVNGDGFFPLGGLVIDAAGNLYGTTSQGLFTGGIVFELTPGSNGLWTESILHTFIASGDGSFPVGGLTLDSSGNLYGTTSSGGSVAQGTVFEMTPAAVGTWTESILYSFKGGSDGAGPWAAVVFDSAGNLYGTTKAGGGGVNCGPQAGGCGTVFKLAPSGSGTWTETVLTAFTTQASSGYPLGNLISDVAGDFYGTTSINGVGPTASGEVFKVTP
jgi:uncharacterized repeat protein (TIGR03803 family)